MQKIYALNLLFLFFSLVASAIVRVEFSKRDEKHLKIDRRVWDLLFPTSQGLGLECVPGAQRIRVTCDRKTFLTFLSLLLDQKLKHKSLERIRESLFPINVLSLTVLRDIPARGAHKHPRREEIEAAVLWWESPSRKGYKVFADSEFERVQIACMPQPIFKHKATGLIFLACEAEMSLPLISSKYILNVEAFVKNGRKRLGLIGPIVEGFSDDKFSAITQSNFLGLSMGILALQEEFEDYLPSRVQESHTEELEIRNFLFVTADGSFKLAVPLMNKKAVHLLDSFWRLDVLLPKEMKSSLSKNVGSS